MKSHLYYSLSGAALLCLMLAGRPCLAAGTAASTATAAPTGGYDFGWAATGEGLSPLNPAGKPDPLYGNTNVPYSQYSNLSGDDWDKIVNEPYDKTAIHELNNVINPDGSTGQQIFDHSADNIRGVPTAGTPGTPGHVGTYRQIPIGRTGVNPGTHLPGLQPTTTAIQAGISYGPQGYQFTQTDQGKYAFTYGFDGHPQPKPYGGAYYNASYPWLPPGSQRAILPPTSTGGVWLNSIDLHTMPMP